MIDALDTLNLLRAQSMRQAATRMTSTQITRPLVNIFKDAPNLLKADQFQKSLQPEVGALPTALKKAVSQPVRSTAEKVLLEKPAPSGGSGGLFQTLKSNFLDKVTPAPVQGATLAPVKKLQQAIDAMKLNIQEAAPKPAGQGQSNPFRTMEAVLLNLNTEAAGLKNAALSSQSISGAKPELNPSPASGLAAVTLPLAGISLISTPVLGPTALLAKPALLNPFVARLPIIIP